MQTGGALVWLGAAVGFFVLEAVAAAAVVPPYNYADHYISALGVPARSPRAAAMNTALYAQGMLFFAGAVLVVRGTAASHSRVFLCLAAINTVGNIAVATVHQGSAVSASGWGWLHGWVRGWPSWQATPRSSPDRHALRHRWACGGIGASPSRWPAAGLSAY